MKSYLKGVITGFLIAAAVFAVPAIADNIDVLFDEVRINVNGVDKIQWGENITLSDGTEAPSSILYNGTTYLPMRKLGDLSGQKIYWNGDSKTVSMTRQPKDINVIAEKPDKNGNVWKYYTFNDGDGNNYLGVKDEVRGYERVYRIAGDTVRVTDDTITFAKMPYYDNTWHVYSGYITELPFANDENTQDGEEIYTIFPMNNLDDAVFDGDYLFYSGRTMGTSDHSVIIAYDCAAKQSYRYDAYRWSYIDNMRLVESTNEKTVIKYGLQATSRYYDGEIVFDKTTNTFGTATETERKDN